MPPQLHGNGVKFSTDRSERGAMSSLPAVWIAVAARMRATRRVRSRSTAAVDTRAEPPLASPADALEAARETNDSAV